MKGGQNPRIVPLAMKEEQKSRTRSQNPTNVPKKQKEQKSQGVSMGLARFWRDFGSSMNGFSICTSMLMGIAVLYGNPIEIVEFLTSEVLENPNEMYLAFVPIHHALTIASEALKIRRGLCKKCSNSLLYVVVTFGKMAPSAKGFAAYMDMEMYINMVSPALKRWEPPNRIPMKNLSVSMVPIKWQKYWEMLEASKDKDGVQMYAVPYTRCLVIFGEVFYLYNLLKEENLIENFGLHTYYQMTQEPFCKLDLKKVAQRTMLSLWEDFPETLRGCVLVGFTESFSVPFKTLENMLKFMNKHDLFTIEETMNHVQIPPLFKNGFSDPPTGCYWYQK